MPQLSPSSILGQKHRGCMQPTVTRLDGCPIPKALKFKFLREPSPPVPFFLKGGEEKQGLLLRAPLSCPPLPDTDAVRMFHCPPPLPGQGAAAGQQGMRRASAWQHRPRVETSNPPIARAVVGRKSLQFPIQGRNPLPTGDTGTSGQPWCGSQLRIPCRPTPQFPELVLSSLGLSPLLEDEGVIQGGFPRSL